MNSPRPLLFFAAAIAVGVALLLSLQDAGAPTHGAHAAAPRAGTRPAMDATAPPALEPIVDPGTVDAPRDFGCARCEESPSSDPLMVDLAPVDVILLDAITGAPVPRAEVLATDLNGVTQELRSNAAGRIVSDVLLRAGPLNINYAGPPHVELRPLGHTIEPIPAEHCLEWNEPDRWYVPVPTLIPVSVAGPVDPAAPFDLHPYTAEDGLFTAKYAAAGVQMSPGATLLGAKGDVDSLVAELVPVASCTEGVRAQLDPRTTHVAALRPVATGAQARTLLDPKTHRPRTSRRIIYAAPPSPPFRLGLWIDEGSLQEVAGSVSVDGGVRLAGRPLLLDPVRVSREDESRAKELGELFGRGVRYHLKDAAMKRRSALTMAGY